MPRIFIFLLALIMLSACAGTGPAARLNLPRGVAIGQIEGLGADELGRALKTKASGGQSVLSGTVSFVEAVAEERETVPITTKSGKAQTVYKPDPFTQRLWRTREIPTATELQNFDFQRLTGRMVFDWQLTDVSGAILESGNSQVDINRTFGGFMAAEGVAPTRQNSTALAENAPRILAEEMTRAVALDLGREPSPSEIESAPDEWSRKAAAAARGGGWEAARALWLEALGQNPNFAPALYNLGLYYERDKNPEEALKHYQRAFIANASALHRAALSRLTETMLRAGRWVE